MMDDRLDKRSMEHFTLYCNKCGSPNINVDCNSQEVWFKCDNCETVEVAP